MRLFVLLEQIVYMQADILFGGLKQDCHLALSQPDGLVFQFHLKVSLTVWSLV